MFLFLVFSGVENLIGMYSFVMIIVVNGPWPVV